MPERLQPWHALQHLVVANADKVQFHMIYAIGEHTGLTYSSRPDATFESSPYAAYKTTQQLTTQLKTEGMRFGVDFDAKIDNKNSNAAPRLTVLPFIPDVKQDEWLRLFGVDQLDRITQYVGDRQVNILNMYNHQVECARHVERLEETERGGVPFDWIISTREDAHYFHDIDLQKLIIEAQDECDLITKNCLDFSGINMRFQLLRRQRGLHFLKTRLDFYKGMYTDNSTIQNPEMFEDKQANQQSSMMKVCKRPISDVPVNVGRHTTKGDFCFLHYEVEGCVPPEAVRYVNRKRCYPHFHGNRSPRRNRIILLLVLILLGGVGYTTTYYMRGRHTTKGDFRFLPYEVEGCVPPEAVRYVNRKRCYPYFHGNRSARK
jgi:hypothetical protein